MSHRPRYSEAVILKLGPEMTRMFQTRNYLKHCGLVSEARVGGGQRGSRGLREQGFVSGLDFISHPMGYLSGDRFL